MRMSLPSEPPGPIPPPRAPTVPLSYLGTHRFRHGRSKVDLDLDKKIRQSDAISLMKSVATPHPKYQSYPFIASRDPRTTISTITEQSHSFALACAHSCSSS